MISIKIKNYRKPIVAHVPFDIDLANTIREAGRLFNVEYIQADGHELELILARFVHLPHTYSTCRWDGELAKFIAVNFPAS